MKLSDLKTGQRGVIVKVTGHGGFRKRIVEMGFIKGKVVDVLQNAPLQDPVKYKIMGYEVSLRHSEAEMIEVVSEEEAAKMESQNETAEPIPASNHYLSDTQLRNAAMKKRRIAHYLVFYMPRSRDTSLISSTFPAHIRSQHILQKNFTSESRSSSILLTSSSTLLTQATWSEISISRHSS